MESSPHGDNTSGRRQKASKYHKRTSLTTSDLFAFLLIINWSLTNLLRQERVRVQRSRQTFEEITKGLSAEEFKQAFRMSRSSFHVLVSILRPALSRFAVGDKREEEVHRSGAILQVEFRVAVFLRMMAGASYHDLMLVYRIGKSTVYSLFNQVLNVASQVLTWENFPKTENEDAFKQRALRFSWSRSVRNPLPGCVGAVDGIHIQIEKPPNKHHPKQFFSRKGYFSIPVQALVDSCYRFVAGSAVCKGSTHDSVALDISHIGQYLRESKLPRGFWIAGDEAYSPTESLIVPFRKSLASKYESAFNFFLSSHRMHVEQAFGILKKRWGILWRPMKHNLGRVTKIVNVAMQLHNFCINADNGVQKRKVSDAERKATVVELENWLSWYRGEGMVEHFDAWMGEADDSKPEDDNMHLCSKSRARAWLVRIMRMLGMLRPDLKRKREDVEIIDGETPSDEGEERGAAIDDDIEDFDDGEVDVAGYLGAIGDVEEATDGDGDGEDVPILQWRMVRMGTQVMELRGIAV